MERFVFGGYPINSKMENISWLVLEKNGNQAKLISEYALDAQNFRLGEKNTWETSNLRTWLQSDFMQKAFTKKQQEAIYETGYPCWHKSCDGSNVDDGDCYDKVTLLDIKEAQKFFPDEDARIARATKYAQKHGADTEYAPDCCAWWLRCPSVERFGLYEVVCVRANGDIRVWDRAMKCGVRPVITIDLDKARQCQYEMCDDVDEEQMLLEQRLTRCKNTLRDLCDDEELIDSILSGMKNTANNAEEERSEEIPTTTTPGYLYAHYRKVWLPLTIPGLTPGVNFIVRENGTDFKAISLDDIFKERPNAELQRIIQKYESADSYSLDQHARKIAEVFRVNRSAFDSRHDRLSEVYAGNLQQNRTFSALRSFAWTLNCVAEKRGERIEACSLSEQELQEIAEFAARRDWLNYDDTGRFEALCGHSDIHVFYVPDELCEGEGRALLRAWGMRLPAVPLDKLRECLKLLVPLMEQVASILQTGRDSSQPLTGELSDVLYAWCALSIAAKKPFFSEDGPSFCMWSYPSDESDADSSEHALEPADWERSIEEEDFTNSEAGHSTSIWETRNQEWMKKYGSYIAEHPHIVISGKKFVFTGLDSAPFKHSKESPIVQELTAQGGLYRTCISGVTDYLVIGGGCLGDLKMREAIEKQQAGTPIQIIRLEDLEAVLSGEESEEIEIPEETEIEGNIGEELTPNEQAAARDLQANLQNVHDQVIQTQKIAETFAEQKRAEAEREEQFVREQKQKAKRAKVNPERDEACMCVTLDIIQELKIQDKYKTDEAFYEDFSQDYLAYSCKKLRQLRDRVENGRRLTSETKEYRRYFLMAMSVEERFALIAGEVIRVDQELDCGIRFMHVLSICDKWSTGDEAEEVYQLYQKETESYREEIQSKLSGCCEDWLQWETAKPLLYAKYESPDEVSAAGALTHVVNIEGKRVTLYLRSHQMGFASMYVPVLNWFAWYWGIPIKHIWRAAYDGRFDAGCDPLRAEYLEDDIDSGDLSGVPLRWAIEEQFGDIDDYDDNVLNNFENASDTHCVTGTTAQVSKKEGCYIATAVYGSYDAPEVRVLRWFRDEKLKKTALGRAFVRAYYRLSPPLAEKLRNAGWINGLVRSALNCWVRHLNREN